MTIYTCPRCKVTHDYSEREGLIHTIAHILYEDMKDAKMDDYRSADIDYYQAKQIVEWFDRDAPIRDWKWEEELKDYSRFAMYYYAYRDKVKA